MNFDEAVLEAIRRGNRTNRAIRTTLGFPAEDYEPEVDRALQRLRKRGVLRAEKGGIWREQADMPCSTCHGSGRVRKDPA